ncbi:histidine phosphatase family protein [Alkaliphilus sp. B6464]|uniref:histidine phosphatase family protein n=1 Tax=Alkaliphilus sp. B6464 TaxID=2731219 RepID=UPI001BAE0E68|nr:histidine phosphatase family protein [Alkaliphilus sp. B6464]QUH19328.1 histidine phosphatase family protein [Alkaliphilus sp. B6464]
MIEFVVIRHGQSLADIEGRHEGRADFPLTDLGREQAEKLAKWLKQRYNFDTIISSPLKRARETAEIIGSKMNKSVIFNEDLMEWNNGVLAGLLREDANRDYPEPEGGRKYFQAVQNGESMIDLRSRAEHFLADLIHSTKDSKDNIRICIVSHGGLITMLYRSFLNMPIDTNVWLSSGDTGVHLWQINNDKKIVMFTNIQEHLRCDV